MNNEGGEMFKIQMVQGNVGIEDLRNRRPQVAKGGMEFNDPGEYLIATAANSSAKILVGGQTFTLGPQSVMRICPMGSETCRHQEPWSRDVKIFLGRVWMRVANMPKEESAGNATIGIRG